MWVPPWLLRRLILAPAIPVLAVVALALLPVAALGEALVATVVGLARRRRPRWRLSRAWLFGTAYLFGETAGLVVCLLLWLRFAGRLDGRSSQQLHLAVLGAFLTALVRLAGFTFRFRLRVHEPVTRPQDASQMTGTAPVLVLARHAGPGASFVLVHVLMSRYRRAPRIVLTARLRWDPCIDVLLGRLRCRFIHGGGETAIAAVRELAGELGPRDALVLFPEGGDWTPTRQRLAVLRLRRRGLRVQAEQAARMLHVLPPRVAGTAAAREGAPQADVVVFGHTGHDELRDLQSVWAGLPLRRELDVVWWREPAAQVPRGEAAIGAWLFELWRRIDCWIEEQGDLSAAVDPPA